MSGETCKERRDEERGLVALALDTRQGWAMLFLPAARCPLPAARCPLPAARCPLPAARCPLPAALCQLVSNFHAELHSRPALRGDLEGGLAGQQTLLRLAQAAAQILPHVTVPQTG